MERKLKAILVDDERHCLDTLKFDLNRFCDKWLNVVGEANNTIKAAKLLIEEKPDLIFLDIDLPGLSGLEFLDSIGNIDARIVFTTAHSKYAIPAYKFKAEAFLLKPIAAIELKDLVQKIYEEIVETEWAFGKDKLAISDLHSTTYIPYEEIIACESSDNYCKIHLKEGVITTVSKTLKFIEEAISSTDFIRIHQSYLINTKYIRRYLKRDGGSIEMTNLEVFPISKSYKEKVQILLHL